MDEVAQEVEVVPEVGPGSAPGPRWFVSSRYPSPNIGVKPAVGKTDVSQPVKGVYAVFRSFPKPNALQGRGKRGRDNWDNTDLNDSQKWGIYPVPGPIFEPGPDPEDGYKDGVIEYEDENGAKKSVKLKAAQKKANREIIDALRRTGYYIRTRQINEVDITAELAEITWDPIPHCGSVVGAVTRGRVAIKGGQVVHVDAQGAAVPAPQETVAAAPAVRAPSLRGGRKTAA